LILKYGEMGERVLWQKKSRKGRKGRKRERLGGSEKGRRNCENKKTATYLV
jgi:hypothetical protein